MSESKDIDPQDQAALMVDAPGGAEAFAGAESDDLHHGLVGVEKESISVPLVLAIVVVTVVIVTGLVITGFTLTKMTSQETLANSSSASEYPELRDVEAAAAAALTQYGVVDAEAGVFQIPIDQAIDLMVNEAYANQEAGNYTNELVLQAKDN
ncbi:MAG: hypothetical protein AAF564_23920 [Bacteroidota bacterium]